MRFVSLGPVVLSQTLPLRGGSIAYAAVSTEQAWSISSGNQWLCHEWLLDSVYFVRIDLLSGLENELKMMKSTGQAWLRVLRDAGAPLNPAQCLTLYEMNLCTDSKLYLYLSLISSLPVQFSALTTPQGCLACLFQRLRLRSKKRKRKSNTQTKLGQIRMRYSWFTSHSHNSFPV